MHGKGVSIMSLHFRSRWAKRSADADRKSLGNFGPAFVSDLVVLGHVQAGQARVDLQDINRKRMVSGALTGLKIHETYANSAACGWPFTRIWKQQNPALTNMMTTKAGLQVKGIYIVCWAVWLPSTPRTSANNPRH